MLPILLTGLGIGLLVAAQVGPIWLLLVRCSIRDGFAVGAAIGLGAASVDTMYAVLGLLGAAALLSAPGVQLAVGLLGAAVLAWIGLRTLHDAFRVRIGGEAPDDVRTPVKAFVTAVVATASNPLTILSWAAIFGAASTASLASTPAHAITLLIGLSLGTFTMHLTLAGAASRLGRHMGDRSLRIVDALSGAGIVVFAGILGVRTVQAN